MFSRWGAFVYRHRRPIAILAVILAVASASLASQVTGALSAGGWTDPDSESAAVAQRLEDEFGAGGGAIIALFEGTAGDDARSDDFQAEIAASLDRLLADDRVDGVVGWAETRDDRFISTDGTSAYVVVRLAITDEAAVDEMGELRTLIDQPTDLTLLLTGVAPATQDQAEQSEKELVQAETVSFPFAALILILVFASLVAAGMPLVVAALAIPTTLGGVYLAAQVTELSIYVQNVATMLGLALAIDYSLFMVSRFREELRKGRDVPTAVEITVATSGKAVDLLRAGRRGRPVRAAPVRAERLALVRHRWSAHRGRVRLLRADVPAGGPRHARASRQLGRRGRIARSDPAGGRPAGRRGGRHRP